MLKKTNIQTIYFQNGEGQHSDPLYNTTLEAPPSDRPTNIVVRNVTNSTMFVEWTKPYNMNGVLRYYIVEYNRQTIKVEEVSHVELTNLQASQNYTIRVAACTVDCSEKSDPIHVLTDIGVPPELASPTVRFVNSSQVKLEWKRPSDPAGPLSYYQIRSGDGEVQNTTKNGMDSLSTFIIEFDYFYAKLSSKLCFWSLYSSYYLI